MRFQRKRFFRNRPTKKKNCVQWPCLLTERDENNTLYREPSIDASYILSFRSFSYAVSEEQIFLEIYQPERRIAYGRHIC
jgi:hypothetical protein